MKLKNKIVWITGASSGIGKALALELSQYDLKLILSSRNEKKLEEVRGLCKRRENVKILKLDLSNAHSLNKVFDDAISCFGGVDILINNAGVSQRSLAAETELKVTRKIFEINYFGTIALTKTLLPHFKAKKDGQVVIISSVVGKIGTPLRSSYAASKHALHGYFDSLRAELHQDNIRISLICPGFVSTNVSINALVGDGGIQGTIDKATANGLSPEIFAKKAIRAIVKKRQEVVIGGFLEILAVYVKRFFPLVLAKMIRKIDVT